MMNANSQPFGGLGTNSNNSVKVRDSHVTEVVAGEGALAHLIVQHVDITRKHFNHLLAYEWVDEFQSLKSRAD